MFVVSWAELAQDFASDCGHYVVKRRKFHFLESAFDFFMYLTTEDNVELLELKVQKRGSQPSSS